MTSQNEAGTTASPAIIDEQPAPYTRWVAAALLLLSIACTTTGCSTRAEAADGDSAAAATTTATVHVRTAAAIERPAAVSVSGAVEANTTAELAFNVSGRIAGVPVEEGQTVRAGQLLATIDAVDYRLAAEQAVARAAQASDEYDRMRALFDRGSLPANDYEKFEMAARVAAAQAAQAREQLDDTRLFSPISGIVVRRGIDLGEMASPGVPAFSVVSVDPVTIRVGIPEAQIGLVRRGASATIAVPALAGRPFRARVSMIGVSADPTSRTYPVKLDVPNPNHELLPGMIAEARIEGDRIVHALTLPGEAVVRDAEGATLVFVYFPAERRVYSRRVTVGSPIDREVEITQGLEPGELVVVAGQDRLRDGMPVTATAEGAAPAPAPTNTAAGSAEEK